MAEDAQTAIDAAEAALTAALAGPRKAESETTSVEAHSLSDMIKAAEYKRKVAASRRRLGGISVTKLVPPGAD